MVSNVYSSNIEGIALENLVIFDKLFVCGLVPELVEFQTMTEYYSNHYTHQDLYAVPENRVSTIVHYTLFYYCFIFISGL